MSSKLENKIALVTGASRGIGRAIALRLAADGAVILAHYGQSATAAQTLVAEIRKQGGRAYALAADLGDSTGPAKLLQEVEATLEKNGLPKRVDILVNNAGVAEMAGLEETTETQFDRMFQVNVKSLFFVVQKVIPLIPEGGRIVNVSSVVAKKYFPGIPAYSATKGAVDTLTLQLAGALGARNITVNSVAPGATETDMAAAFFSTPEQIAQVTGMQAIGRVGKPDDIADAVAFLAGPDGRWVTGQVLAASGGARL